MDWFYLVYLKIWTERFFSRSRDIIDDFNQVMEEIIAESLKGGLVQRFQQILVALHLLESERQRPENAKTKGLPGALSRILDYPDGMSSEEIIVKIRWELEVLAQANKLLVTEREVEAVEIMIRLLQQLRSQEAA